MPFTSWRPPIGVVLALLVSLAGVWIAFDAPAGGTRGPLPFLHTREAMPPLDGAVEWLNTKPLTADELRGKVVLVEFWTYTCINWLRTLPHVRAWAEKYKDKGLVVIGVHTPEFGFEKDLDRIREATKQLDVNFPVAVDSRWTIWRAFRNSAWPALYFVDAQGAIRHRHDGEGDFERSEMVIQQLLAEAGAKDVGTGLVRVEGKGSQAQADWANLRSPETYIGYERADGFASPGGFTHGRARSYAAPQQLRLNNWALSGDWAVGAESATLDRANGRLAYRFHARDLHLVMGPAMRGKPVPFRILLDGKPPAAARGADVDEEGRGVLVENRLYQLVRQTGAVEDRLFEIEFLEPGVEAFAFTFG